MANLPEPIEFALWPGEPPFAYHQLRAAWIDDRPVPAGYPAPHRGLHNVSQPTLTLHRPAAPNGAAVVICPGGGFYYLEIDKEGSHIARWLAELGVTAVVLHYRTRPDIEGPVRTPMDPVVAQAILADGLRAVRVVRQRAAEWGVDPTRIGAMGFSAGGALVSWLATQWDEPDPLGDAAGAVSARPDFLAPIYGGFRPETAARVNAQTPPAFVAATDDDRSAPENGMRLYTALRAAGVSCELHIYRSGGHGFAMRPDGPSADWRARFAVWLRDLGVM